MCLYPKKMIVKSSRPIGEVLSELPNLETGEIQYNCLTVVKCGSCYECLNEHSTEWAFRVIDECKCHFSNCVVTLTYNNEHLPAGGNLCRKDLQDFIKRLRRAVEPQKVRVFYCGEYGSHHLRPHYHIILFGFKPDDLVEYKVSKKGSKLFKSAFIDKIWHMGFADVGEVDFQTAKYSAKYLQKLQKIPDNMVQPFVGMSNRPGIGFLRINPNSLNSDKIYQNGKFIKTPRYYLKKLEESGFDINSVIFERSRKALEFEVPIEELRERREQARKKMFDIYLNPF